MPKKRNNQSEPVTDEDARLFRDAIGDIRPLAPKPESGHVRTPPAPHPAMFERDEAAVRDELLDAPIDPAAHEVGEELLYLREGHSPQLLKRLRRGVFSIQDEMDLHQMDERAARATLDDFLADARRRGIQCVRIVHGKGLHSESGVPVLKNLVDRVLRQRADVLAFHSAPPAQGGHGAVLVLLAAGRAR